MRKIDEYYRFSHKYLLILFAVFYAFIPSYAEDVIVESEGIGTTKMEAMNNAWTEAVRKAVGENVKASDSVIAEELTEKQVLQFIFQV